MRLPDNFRFFRSSVMLGAGGVLGQAIFGGDGGKTSSTSAQAGGEGGDAGGGGGVVDMSMASSTITVSGCGYSHWLSPVCRLR